MSFPIAVQIKAVERELRFRRHVYARRVSEKKMSKANADHEIGAMEAVLETLKRAEQGERLL